jgi:hypothetical protein
MADRDNASAGSRFKAEAQNGSTKGAADRLLKPEATIFFYRII